MQRNFKLAQKFNNIFQAYLEEKGRVNQLQCIQQSTSTYFETGSMENNKSICQWIIFIMLILILIALLVIGMLRIMFTSDLQLPEQNFTIDLNLYQ